MDAVLYCFAGFGFVVAVCVTLLAIGFLATVVDSKNEPREARTK